ncbi:hypothetical protein [Elizabethkingia anophelis]|uniref:Uncharacterized protein n=1 Tax=Elizabethkingia anophelis TaxID=1117645 RepID=A0AAU8VGN0_9FLAO|nr:hypothetical protein [Elizabethkingia anophelis]AQX02056.1 hypothetical protein BBD32_11565 [Elizabethkingia anophelis]KFC38788.1 hypothetical protein FF18_15465 [Elizabethkingia anophelis]MCL1035158.1 hypothetical protein [Elizabethkingia anophelis]MCT3787185.1 hypothetical protein [Elizabethkingia anophelis]MCW2464425.1 hypothetical protein [Elizabethkingia anophelis]
MRKKKFKKEMAANLEKVGYVEPKLKVVYVEMESGVAAGSATLNPGDVTSPAIPVIDDWNDNGNVGSKDFDI